MRALVELVANRNIFVGLPGLSGAPGLFGMKGQGGQSGTYALVDLADSDHCFSLHRSSWTVWSCWRSRKLTLLSSSSTAYNFKNIDS